MNECLYIIIIIFLLYTCTVWMHVWKFQCFSPSAQIKCCCNKRKLYLQQQQRQHFSKISRKTKLQATKYSIQNKVVEMCVCAYGIVREQLHVSKACGRAKERRRSRKSVGLMTYRRCVESVRIIRVSIADTTNYIYQRLYQTNAADFCFRFL